MSPAVSAPKAKTAVQTDAQKLVFPVDPGRSIDVGFVADPSFITERGPDVEGTLLQLLKVIDGIYLWQLGVEIRLVELMLLDTDPFSTNNDDEAGSPCASPAPNFLMEPFFNGSDTFSQCSIGQMLPVIDAATCFEDWPSTDLSFRIVDATAVIARYGSG